MADFIHKKCVPCEGGIDPLRREKVDEYLKVVPGWVLRQAPTFAEASAGRQDDPSTGSGQARHDQIEREFKFKDFKEAMEFVNKVAAIAEEEGHHPNMYLYSWNKVRLELYTHAIGGLHENDFVIAAKVNALEHSNV